MWNEEDYIDRTVAMDLVDDLAKPVLSAVPAADSRTATEDLRELLEQIRGKIYALEDQINTPLLTRSVNCPNCGGTTEMDVNNHILRCKYCRSVIFVGTQHTNG